MGDKGKKEAAKPRTIPKYMNFIIGGTAGMMGISVVQPADLLKTRMQLLGPAGKNASFVGVAKEIVRKEGILGFYVGLSAALLRQATYGTGRLGCFNAMFDWHKANRGVPNFPTKIAMGVVSGAFGAWIGTPAEVALIRMTADGRLPPEMRRNYTNVFNALIRITREEGITTLWRGAGATVSRAMVVNGAQLGSYSQAREMLLPYMYDGLPLHAAAAMIAGFVTTVASLPVDIVKTSIFYVASVRTSLQECQLKISVGYLFCPAYNEVATPLA
ncbi:mitochondrial 2-oxoglutarate/malate carrier protein isoform X7 [Spodoptera frugiperda]|uniref:Mitochondrial 2-oxoglutarate/malate carrier protein isoform X7 n=1 Tax=Spodoptera frugiperda TaxID=7108 RepID=A0A9R0ELM5_SPOFR|nr:mitochondrial 2-oxoglutarate/malate carrier protein isoform X7 [Spodoptera frugiperda]